MTFPPDFTHPKAKWATAQYAAECIARIAPGRRAVVQAGGCSGLWPLALSTYFDQVFTCEPAPTNVRYLRANTAGVVNIAVYACALGETSAHMGLTRDKAQAGRWRVEGEGAIPVIPLDELIDEPIDALVLDVEGAELQAWRGAERLIATYRPLLWFEYLHNRAAIDAFLESHGYGEPLPGVGGDYYSVSKES